MGDLLPVCKIFIERPDTSTGTEDHSCFSWTWAFLIKKISHIVEKDSELSQNIWYFVKLKFLKADDLLLLFLKKRKKKLFFILGMAHADPFVVQIGPPKNAIPTGFFFFQNYWIATEVININWIP